MLKDLKLMGNNIEDNTKSNLVHFGNNIIKQIISL